MTCESCSQTSFSLLLMLCLTVTNGKKSFIPLLDKGVHLFESPTYDFDW